MKETKISWAHSSQNFWTGCNPVDKDRECSGCYADALLTRSGREFTTLSLTQTWRDAYTINAQAARKNSLAIVFTCSLSDFYHLQADRWRNDAWSVIRDCTHVRWLILTKRPERIVDHLPSDWGSNGWKHVWLGTTCGHPDSYPRLNVLREIPCALRFISAEPLLAPLDDIDLSGYGWVAAGGMSGALHHQKHMRLEWAFSLWKRCKSDGIPFLFKQASHQFTERGIDALSRYSAMVEGKPQSDNLPLVREYPATDLPLLPFTTHGRRFTEPEFEQYMMTRNSDLVQIGEAA
jgi:protein gp37